MPIRQKMTEMGKFNEELVKAGIMLVGEGLKPSSTGVRIRFSLRILTRPLRGSCSSNRNASVSRSPLRATAPSLSPRNTAKQAIPQAEVQL
jgi:hypothetical protein